MCHKRRKHAKTGQKLKQNELKGVLTIISSCPSEEIYSEKISVNA